MTSSPVSTSLRSRPDLLLMMVFVSSLGTSSMTSSYQNVIQFDEPWRSLEIPGAVLWLVGHNLRKKHVLQGCSGLRLHEEMLQQFMSSTSCSKRYQRYQRYQPMPWPCCSSGGRPRKPHRSRRKLSDDPCTIESTESKTTRRPENTQKQLLPWLRIGYTLAAHKLHIATLQQAGQGNISTLWTLDIDRLLLPSRGH